MLFKMKQVKRYEIENEHHIYTIQLASISRISSRIYSRCCPCIPCQNVTMLLRVFWQNPCIYCSSSPNIWLITLAANSSLVLKTTSYSFLLTNPNMFSIGENYGLLLGVSSSLSRSDPCTILITCCDLCAQRLSKSTTTVLSLYFSSSCSTNPSKCWLKYSFLVPPP